jgi:hypothetical protein
LARFRDMAVDDLLVGIIREGGNTQTDHGDDSRVNRLTMVRRCSVLTRA